MPDAPPHGCAHPGCPELVSGRARCEVHDRARRMEMDSFRGSAASRGYGAAWRELRLRFLRAHPLCAHCLQEGRSIAATDVDHIISKAQGGTDAWNNLQSLCHSHHSTKTARHDGGLGRRPRRRA